MTIIYIHGTLFFFQERKPCMHASYNRIRPSDVLVDQIPKVNARVLSSNKKVRTGEGVTFARSCDARAAWMGIGLLV